MNVSLGSKDSTAEDLCLACGLCCNGVIFADVKLQPDDNPGRLSSLTMPLSSANSGTRAPCLRQPCPAFDGCRCRIYADRPQYCRQFECLLLKSVKAGRTEPAAALRAIRAAHKRADKVRHLLRLLGDADEQVALSARFRRTARRLEQVGLDQSTAALYGELTLAVHDLNLLLSEAFYPGG